MTVSTKRRRHAVFLTDDEWREVGERAEARGYRTTGQYMRAVLLGGPEQAAAANGEATAPSRD